MKLPSTIIPLSVILIICLTVQACKDNPIAAEDPEVYEIFDCSKCTFLVTDYRTDGETLNIKPGDIICLEADTVYGPLLFQNIKGAGGQPIIIRNCGGVATINSEGSFGMKFENSDNFQLLGDGAATKYGIKVSTQNGFFISMERFTTDFELARMEIAGLEPKGIGENNGFAGIGIKTSPYQACEVFTDETRQAWIMRNVWVHDNYIHDTGGEGLYIGHGFYTGRKESDCDQITYSHSIQHISIHDNLIENVGYDGIQIKNADFDVQVYNNQIISYGNLEEGAHNEGLFIGEGSTGDYYNNLILNGTGNGIQYQGIGNTNIFNNIIVNAGGSGFFGANGQFVYRLPDGYHNIINNTFVNSGRFGFVFYNEEGGVKRLINNLVVSATEELKPKGAILDSSNNIFSQHVGLFNFSGLNDGLIKTSANAPNVNAGKDASQYGVKTDYYGTTRPQGGIYDIGAHEQ